MGIVTKPETKETRKTIVNHDKYIVVMNLFIMFFLFAYEDVQRQQTKVEKSERDQ
jgi:hypothetical protein